MGTTVPGKLRTGIPLFELRKITVDPSERLQVWAQRAGCVGYETGGAQYQAGLIRGFDPAKILTEGLPYNMPAHSLQRAQYVNGEV